MGSNEVGEIAVVGISILKFPEKDLSVHQMIPMGNNVK